MNGCVVEAVWGGDGYSSITDLGVQKMTINF